MTAAPLWPWAALLALGAVHGVNPAMGWLFAVARGMQEQERGAVWRTLLPLAAGHAAAIVAAVALAALVGVAIPLDALRWVVAAILLGFGALKLRRAAHPRWARMRVNGWQLTLWSFLMASAHGAGLMVLPLVLVLRSAPMHAAGAHVGHLAAAVPPGAAGPLGGLAVALVHTAGYLLVTGAVAAVVYEKTGLRLLGRMWLNVDRVWAGALIATAVLTPALH